MTARPALYVSTALRLLSETPDGVVSSAQVAYHVHRTLGSKGPIADHANPADEAIYNSGHFWAVPSNRRAGDVSLWRLKPADWRVSA